MVLSKVFQPLFRPFASPKARGGWRQQQYDESDVMHVPRTSHSFVRHVRYWSEGGISGPVLWEQCEGMVLDGMRHPAVVRIAEISRSIDDSDLSAKLIRLFSDTCRLGEVVTAVHGDPHVSHLLLPSSIMRWVHRNRRDLFVSHWGADAVKIEQFWLRLFSTEAGKELQQLHPGLVGRSPHSLRHSIPCVLHEDAGPFTKRKSTNIISWSPLLANVLDIRQKIGSFTYIKVAGMGHECGAGAWKLFLDDFEALESGVVDGAAVCEDDDGTRWCQILLFDKGDGEAHHVGLGLPGYSSKYRVCGYCHADRDGLPWTDCRPCALWRGIRLTNKQFLATVRPGHPLVKSRFWNRFCPRIDIMHGMDCKGLTAIVAGSIFFKLVWLEPRLGATKADRLAEVNILLNEFYRANPCGSRLYDLREENITGKTAGSHWVCLHGPTVKAAATRHLAPFLRSITVQFFSGPSAEHQAIFRLCHALDDAYTLMYDGDMFLPAEDLAAISVAFETIGVSMQTLRGIHMALGSLLFQMTPKVHLCMHVPEQCQLINARFTQCYGEESMVQRWSHLWHSCAHGPYQRTAQFNVLIKYLVQFAIRMDM